MTDDLSGADTDLPLHALHREARVSEALFRDGHYRVAVQMAAERFNIRVAELSERHDLTGGSLVNNVFSDSHPLLVFSETRSALSERDVHNGYRYLALGLTLGVRNVYTHDIRLEVSKTEALEWLAFISAMHRRLDRTSQTRAREAMAAETPERAD